MKQKVLFDTGVTTSAMPVLPPACRLCSCPVLCACEPVFTDYHRQKTEGRGAGKASCSALQNSCHEWGDLLLFLTIFLSVKVCFVWATFAFHDLGCIGAPALRDSSLRWISRFFRYRAFDTWIRAAAVAVFRGPAAYAPTLCREKHVKDGGAEEGGREARLLCRVRPRAPPSGGRAPPLSGQRRPWGGGRQDGGAGGAACAAAALRRRALRVAALRPLWPRWARCPGRSEAGLRRAGRAAGAAGQGRPGGASARWLLRSGWSGGAAAAGGADLRRAARAARGEVVPPDARRAGRFPGRGPAVLRVGVRVPQLRVRERLRCVVGPLRS